MKPLLSQEQREQITITELAKYIFRLAKEGRINITNLQYLHEQLCPENKVGYAIRNKEFFLKFYEAIALLKRRGLLMDVITGGVFPKPSHLHLTSIGEKSDLHDGILILIDDPQEIVNSVREKVPTLDAVVEQYYLESLRACQEGLYISSVICLGAASERAINCLAEAIINHNPNYRIDIENQRTISALTRYLSDNINRIFGSITDGAFRSQLRDKLEGIARIYRLNRNEAGHPDNIPQDWQRDEQENYLHQFRRYIMTIFEAIEIF